MSKKILIIEDHPETAEMIADILSFGKIESIIAFNGVLGLQKALEEKPALILLDIMMPEMNGLEVCKRLKANPETSQIPIVFVSVRSEKQDVTDGKGAGAVEYVKKPFDPYELIEVVKRYI